MDPSNAQKVNVRTAHPASETRSVSEAVAETAALSLTALLLVFIPFSIIGAVDSPDAALRAAGSAGEALIPHVGWALTGNVTVLLGFYLVVIGGQILDGGDAARTRRVFGFVAELMAAASTSILALIIVHCTQNPDAWGVIVAVLPMVMIIVFLAAQVGRFFILDREQRLAAAVITRDTTRRRLRRLAVRSRRHFLLVFPVNVGAATVIGLLATFIVGIAAGRTSEQAAIMVYATGIFVVLAGVLFAWIVLASYLSEVDPGWLNRTVFILLSVVVLAVVARASVSLMEAGFAELGWGAAVVCAVTIIFAVSPPPSGRRRLVDWSFRAAIRTVMARRRAKTYARAVREIMNLRVPPTTPTLIQRLRTRLYQSRITAD
jgi:hypothetical protein